MRSANPETKFAVVKRTPNENDKREEAYILMNGKYSVGAIGNRSAKYLEAVEKLGEELKGRGGGA